MAYQQHYNRQQQQQEQPPYTPGQHPQQHPQQPPHNQHGHPFPQPLFLAELDVPQRKLSSDASTGMPMSPTGEPIFEMSAEPVTSGKEDAEHKKPAPRQDTDQPPQANPWPFYLENQQHITASPVESRSRSKTEGSAPGTPMANLWPYHGPAGGDEVLSPTVIGSPTQGIDMPKMPEIPEDSDILNQHRPSLGSPTGAAPDTADSPASLVPAPLSIKRTSQQQQSPQRTYKAYSPAHEEEDTVAAGPAASQGTLGVGAGHQTTMAYRPYRRPSFQDQEPVPETEPSTTVSPPPGPPPAISSAAPPAAATAAAAAVVTIVGSSTSPSPRPSPAVGAASPRLEGVAPHHFHIPSPPPPSGPPLKSRPSQVQLGAVSHTAGTSNPVGGFNTTPSPSKSHVPVASPPPTTTVTPGPTQHATEEIVLWPHQTGPSPGVSGTQPQYGSPAQMAPHPSSAPTSTVTSPMLSAQHSPGYYSSIPPPHHQPTPTSTLGFVPQPTYAPTGTSHSQPSSPQPLPPTSSSGPQSPQQALPQQALPQSPPPPYSQAVPGPISSQSSPLEKPSYFPPAPPSSAPPQQQSQYPIQPTYAPTSSNQPPSTLPSPHGTPSPYNLGQPSPYGAISPSPYQPPAHGQPQPPHIQPAYVSQQQQPPQPQHPYHQAQSPPIYGQPPPQHGSDFNLAPPPLPPRPASAHSYGGPPHGPHGPPPVGFSSVPPVAYPPPPKTHYVPGPGGPKPPSSGGLPPSHSYQGRPNAGGKIFGSSVAKKWLDKTNQMVESKVEEILRNQAEARNRFQQNQLPPSQSQGHLPQQYPPQQPPYHSPNTYQQPHQQPPPQPQYTHGQGGGRGYGMPPPGR
jgi:hypothetical protein